MNNLPERAEEGKTYTAEELSNILYILQDRQQRDHKANVDRLDGLGTKTDDMEYEISDMNEKVDKIDDMEEKVDKIDDIESKVDDIDISSIENQIDDLDSKIDDLPDMEDIKSDVVDNRDDIDQHSNRLEDLESAIPSPQELPEKLLERVKEMEKKIFTYKELAARGIKNG